MSSLFDTIFMIDPLVSSQLPGLLEDAPRNKNRQQLSTSRQPRLDVTETDKAYVFHADLPGLAKENVSISIQDHTLTIEGERSAKKEEKNEHRHIVERSFGKFSRSLALPKDANTKEVKATMEHGVLELVFTKKAEDEGKQRITVQ